MRYGVVQITKEMMMGLLGLGEPMGRCKKYRLVTDIPDDIEIIDAGWDETKQIIRLYVKGSGSPLYKCAEGATIPNIDLRWEEVKE